MRDDRTSPRNETIFESSKCEQFTWRRKNPQVSGHMPWHEKSQASNPRFHINITDVEDDSTVLAKNEALNDDSVKHKKPGAV